MQADTYFEEVTGGEGGSRYVPRSVQVDLETGVADRVRCAAIYWAFISLNAIQIRSGPIGRLFRPDTSIMNSCPSISEPGKIIILAQTPKSHRFQPKKRRKKYIVNGVCHV